MDAPDSIERNKAEIGSNLADNGCFANPIDKLSAQDMNEKENSESLKVECCGTDGLVVEHRDGPVSIVKSNGLEDSSMLSFINTDLGSAETKDNLDPGVITSSDKVQNGFGGGIVDDKSCGKLGSLSCSIEKGLEKVSLVAEDRSAAGRDLKLNSSIVSDDPESNSESESESESETSSSSAASSSSSSAASSSSSGSDDDKDELVKKEALCNFKQDGIEPKGDVQIGEVLDTDVEKMVSWTGAKSDDDDDDSDDDVNQEDIAAGYCHDLELGNDIDDDLPKEPIRSKNELQVLPPVPQVTVSLQPDHQILPVGVVLSVLGTQVIVEGSEKHNPLSEGSILWIAERRLPLGIVDEIFGPVKTPYYIIRYNSESEVPSDIQNGLTIGFVPEFVDHILNDKNLYRKGYDASGENDEEICDETEFSDDEKEAEYKKMLKKSKRENNNESERPGNKKNTKSRENSSTNNNQPFISQPPTVRHPQPNQLQQQLRPPSPFFSQGNQSGRPTFVQGFSGGPCAQSLGHGNQQSPVFLGGSNATPQMPPLAQLLLNSNWGNGMPSHHPNMAMALPNGFQPNCMPWLQQNQQMFPTGNPGQFQQQFDFSSSQLVTGNNGSSFGPMNFNAGAPNSPWPGMMGANPSFQAPFMAGAPNFNAVAPNVQLPMFPGFLPNGPQQPTRPGSNFSPATSFPGNEEASSQTRQGASPGRGRGRTSFQHRGGRFGGGRGRQK
ncbi:uncharacterized protein LOC141652445 [Silene latifolia]|uniref:uncharacterized protein LOC141652445 n=1 Tax=Silene latifolia TaxID=37657 RepID=UPI003D789A5C